MRPFFSYYGAKYTGALHYGCPKRSTIIEPFAGSACYSTRWNAVNAKLYDVSLSICSLWDWLISCSEKDVKDIPDSFDDFEQILQLATGPQTLVRFWVAKGRAEPSGKISPWYMQYRNDKDCRVWGPAVKRRIIEQKVAISKWQIECLSYDKIPLFEAHWHVDPPYNNSAGSRYPHSNLDFNALGEWCQKLPGHVDVCEQVGATWLPFRPLYNVVSSRGRRTGYKSQEAIWSTANTPPTNEFPT